MSPNRDPYGASLRIRRPVKHMGSMPNAALTMLQILQYLAPRASATSTVDFISIAPPPLLLHASAGLKFLDRVGRGVYDKLVSDELVRAVISEG